MWGHFKKLSLLGGPKGVGLALNRPLVSPGGVPRQVLVKKTCQATFQKSLRGLAVISEILQFRPSGPGPHGPIWSSTNEIGFVDCVHRPRAMVNAGWLFWTVKVPICFSTQRCTGDWRHLLNWKIASKISLVQTCPEKKAQGKGQNENKSKH